MNDLNIGSSVKDVSLTQIPIFFVTRTDSLFEFRIVQMIARNSSEARLMTALAASVS